MTPTIEEMNTKPARVTRAAAGLRVVQDDGTRYDAEGSPEPPAVVAATFLSHDPDAFAQIPT